MRRLRFFHLLFYFLAAHLGAHFGLHLGLHFGLHLAPHFAPHFAPHLAPHFAAHLDADFLAAHLVMLGLDVEDEVSAACCAAAGKARVAAVKAAKEANFKDVFISQSLLTSK